MRTLAPSDPFGFPHLSPGGELRFERLAFGGKSGLPFRFLFGDNILGQILHAEVTIICQMIVTLLVGLRQTMVPTMVVCGSVCPTRAIEPPKRHSAALSP